MINMRLYFVYILTNAFDTVFYTGVTNDLARRVIEHKHGKAGGFTSRYRVFKLVFYEMYNDINLAINREKQIKGGSRQKKIDLINSMNPDWQALADHL